jgi:hypothetical protein
MMYFVFRILPDFMARHRYIPTLLVTLTAFSLFSACGKSPIQNPQAPPKVAEETTDAITAEKEKLEEKQTLVEKQREVLKKEDAAKLEAKHADVTRPLLAREIDDERLLLHGLLAEGQFGDFALRNEHVHAIIAKREHPPAGTPIGGVLSDLGLRERGEDYIRWYQPTLNQAGQFDHRTESVEVTNDGLTGELAEIKVTGTVIPPAAKPLKFITYYRLRPGDTALEIETVYENHGEEDSPALTPTDSANWGGAIPFIPGRGYRQPSPTMNEFYEAEWMAGLADINDYSVVVYNKERGFLCWLSQFFTNLRWAYKDDENTVVQPSKSFSLTRYLIPGTRDFGSGMTQAYQEQGIGTGELFGRVVEVNSNIPLPFAEVRLLQVFRRADGAPRPFARTYADEAGEFHFATLPGEYITRAHVHGRRQPGTMFSSEVESFSSTEKLHRLSIPIIFQFDVKDADTGENIPCKVTFSEARNAPFPRLGRPWEAPYAANTYFSITGNGRITAPKGKFTVTFSAGPEYDVFSEAIEFDWQHRTKPYELDVKLKRITPTTDYIAADIGAKTEASLGCNVSLKARLMSAVAEGVEFLIITDENTLTDPRPMIDELGLQDRLRVAGGIQFRDYKRQMPGVFSVFPVPFNTPKEKVEKVAEAVTQMESPDEIFKLLRKEFTGALIQIDDPIDPETGYLTRMGYEYKAQYAIYTQWDEKYSTNYDLIQLMHGREMKIDDWEQRLEAWHQVVLTGHDKARYTAGSASKGVYGEETGYPRTYIEAGTDDPAKLDINELMRSLKRGAVVASMGPFIDLKVDDARPGSFQKAKDDGFAYFDEIKVLAPKWQLVNTVSFDREGSFANRAFVVKPGFPQQYPTPYDTHSIRRIRIRRDTYIQIQAEAVQTMAPVLAKVSPLDREVPVPRAITGPIFLDYDGDGQYTPPIPSRRVMD